MLEIKSRHLTWVGPSSWSCNNWIFIKDILVNRYWNNSNSYILSFFLDWKKYIYQYFLFYLVNNYLFFLHFRVFKKGSPNGKITVYLGRRDFVDHVSHVDPIDGVVLVDPEYLNGRKVFGHVLAAFRYGREDLDVLGKNKKKDDNKNL